MLTSFKEDNLIENALQAGAIGYLLKNVSAEEIAAAIRSAVIGRPTLAPEATQVLINVSNRRQTHDSYLTPREKEVLNMMIDGLTNPEIAEKLIRITSYNVCYTKLLRLSDTLVVLTPDRLMWRDPGTGKVTLGPLLGASLGRLHTVLAVDNGLVVAGEAGVTATRLAGIPARSLLAPGDLPGQLFDIAVQGA